MVDIDIWMKKFIKSLKETFGQRIYFSGLQGSFGRGEATDKSDIDVVVILDKLCIDDIKTYNSMLDTLSHRELICGFISGKEELLSWEPSDLFWLTADTIPFIGNFDEVKALIKEKDKKRAVKIGACNIYHALLHNIITEQNADSLNELYKFASFVLRGICVLETGKYVKDKKELLNALKSEDDKNILKRCIEIKEGKNAEFELLFLWSKNVILRFS